ncbi:MAG: MerR family transcriptional regulator [Candidatus Omnitrophota bacterium]
MRSTNKKEFQEVEIDNDMPVFTTGVVCRILDIPVWTLKQLDKEGIVSPPREFEGQSRLYSKRELKKVEQCWIYIRDHSVNIPGLKIILKMEARVNKESNG